MDEVTRRFFAARTLEGLAHVASLLRANPKSLELNALWFQIWLRIGNLQEIEMATQAVKKRTGSEEFMRTMRFHALCFMGKMPDVLRDYSASVLQDSVRPLLDQIRIFWGEEVFADESAAGDRREDLLSAALSLARQGQLGSHPELVEEIHGFGVEDPFYADRAVKFFLGLGETELARSLNDRVGAAYPDYPEPYYIRAWNAFESGNHDLARNLLLRLFDLCPYHTRAAFLFMLLEGHRPRIRAYGPYLRLRAMRLNPSMPKPYVP